MYPSKINRGIKKLSWLGNDSLYSCRLKSIPNNSSGKRILLYHGITENALTDINARFISTERFEKEIAYFKKHFNVVSLQDYVNGAEHPEKLTIAITFDDGYLNNLTEALPILEKHEVPATFFITTIQKKNYPILWTDALDLHRYTFNKDFEFQGQLYHAKKNEYRNKNQVLKHYLKATGWKEKQTLINQILANNHFIKNSDYSPYYQLMTTENIQQLAQSKYATIGSHGLYHNCVTKIPIEDAITELKESKTFLENLTQRKITTLAYPDGDYNPQLINEAEKLGYQIQLSVESLYETDQTDQRIHQRFGINPYISFNNQIQSIINGRY